MSFKSNLPSNFHGSNNTFQARLPPLNIPPPPIPPSFFLPHVCQHVQYQPHVSDQEYVNQFSSKITVEVRKSVKNNSGSITQIRDQLRLLVLTLEELKNKVKLLSENISSLPEIEWASNMQQVDNYKAEINRILLVLNDNYMEKFRKVIAKRTAKRLRLKRLQLKKKREKEERIKELEERSRKIDENLQKFKDEINKVKQEEEAKLKADIVLKEVLRKKNDAKKCIVKLDALMKLRKARQNTARGRGEKISETDSAAFMNNAEKLKLLWTHKLASYDKEENELRAKLARDNEQKKVPKENEQEIINCLSKWREFLFGESTEMPQFDFKGDIDRFISVRSQWDQYISSDGSSMPIGWVVPNVKT